MTGDYHTNRFDTKEVSLDNVVLPSSFKIPDLTVRKEDENTLKIVTFKIKHKEMNCEGEVKFSRDDITDKNKILHREGVARLDLFNLDKDKEHIAGFTAIMSRNTVVKEYKKPENDKKLFFNINYREVQEDYRNKGLGFGELGIRIMEEIARKIKEEYKELDVEYMEIYTYLGKVAKLIIDQNWLIEHGLNQFKKNRGVDLKYLPDEQDQDQVKSILENNLSSLIEAERLQNEKSEQLQDIRLYKKL